MVMKDESPVYADTPDDQRGTGEWTESHSRIWAAHRAKDQEAVLAFVLPQEVEVLITEHLRLLGDLGGFQPGTASVIELEIRAYALARLQSFVESGIVSERRVNILSRFILGEDVFPTAADDECLELADLEFHVEADD